MYICGTEGAVRADVRDGLIELARIGFNENPERIEVGAKGGHGGGDDVLARELADTMLKGEPTIAGFEAGLKSSIVCFAIDEAMETGTVVDLAPYWEKAGI